MPFASTEFRYRKLEHIFFKFYSKHITLCDVEYFGNIFDPSPSPELASHFLCGMEPITLEKGMLL